RRGIRERCDAYDKRFSTMLFCGGLMASSGLSTPPSPTVLDHSLFRDLPGDVADVLLRGSAILHVQTRDILFREGDRADQYLYVQQGSIEVLRNTQDGQERVFQIFEPRRLLAETAM